MDRWQFYKQVHSDMKAKYPGKLLMHMFSIGGTDGAKNWGETQQMVREIEEAGVSPDIWIINNFNGPFPLVPESDASGQPAVTTTGFAYWLLSHLYGDPKGPSLTLTASPLPRAGAVSTSMHRETCVDLVLSSSHAWLDLFPVVRLKHSSAITTRIVLSSGSVAKEYSGGLHQVGRVWPGMAASFSVCAQQATSDGAGSPHATVATSSEAVQILVYSHQLGHTGPLDQPECDLEVDF